MSVADLREHAGNPTWRDSLAAVVAVCGLLAFVVLVVLMFIQRSTSEISWSRLVYLLTGVEAVAFAGAGWIFGKEVHKGEVRRAEKQTQVEQHRAKEAESEARHATATAHAEQLRGVRLVQAVDTARAQQPPARSGSEREIAASYRSADALESVAELARRLYPELYADR